MLFFSLVILSDWEDIGILVSCFEFKVLVLFEKVIFVLVGEVLFIWYFFIVCKVVLRREIVLVGLFDKWIEEIELVFLMKIIFDLYCFVLVGMFL